MNTAASTAPSSTAHDELDHTTLAETRPDVPISFHIRVGPDAAPLLEYILHEAEIEWRELVRDHIDATAVVHTTYEHLTDTVLALRQRLGCHLAQLRLSPTPDAHKPRSPVAQSLLDEWHASMNDPKYW